MNFFEHQHQARRKTGRLVLLFVVAVVLILAAVNLAAYGILRIVSPHMTYVKDAAPVLREDLRYPGTMHRVEPMWNNALIHAGVSLATLVIVAGGSLYKTAMLSRGGHAVASLLGGRPLDPQSAQGQDRVLQNVVEEMSIASGVPVPAVYVLENEEGINAFAAGFTTEDAVIGVTRGCVQRLNRDELQGVVAHEFSHILNGDMRLNVRLIGVLHGILVIGLIGYAILRILPYSRSSSRRSSKDGGGNAVIVIALAGAAMLVIGYLGVFFGRLIQAAVSRQREYLADASAVQFTRNPKGLAGALAKIGGYAAGSRVENYHAVETAHLFFASGIKVGLSGLLATHPPLEDRIRRIDPTFDGRFASPSKIPVTEPHVPRASPMRPAAAAPPGFVSQLSQPRSADAIARARQAFDPNSVVARAGAPTPASVAHADRLIESIPAELFRAAHDPYSARGVVFGLIMSRDPSVRQAQLSVMTSALGPGPQREIHELFDGLVSLSPDARLPLLDIALPALRMMSPQQIGRFKTAVRALVEADRQISLFEYALLRILGQNLRAPDEPARRGPIHYYATSAVKDEAAVLLTALATVSESDTAAAFTAGARRLDPDDPPVLVPGATLAAVDAALNRLAAASPAVKQRVIDACAHTVAADGHVTVSEAELLRAIASSIDVPLPPLLPQLGQADAPPADYAHERVAD